MLLFEWLRIRSWKFDPNTKRYSLYVHPLIFNTEPLPSLLLCIHPPRPSQTCRHPTRQRATPMHQLQCATPNDLPPLLAMAAGLSPLPHGRQPAGPSLLPHGLQLAGPSLPMASGRWTIVFFSMVKDWQALLFFPMVNGPSPFPHNRHLFLRLQKLNA